MKVDLKSCLSPAQKRLLQNKTTITITRCQLPVIPAYVLTTHKCQGKTLESGVIDIVPPPYSKPELAQNYVPISRFTSLEAMAILRPFSRSILNQKPHPDMRAELPRLQSINSTDWVSRQQGSENNYENHMLTRNAQGTIHRIGRTKSFSMNTWQRIVDLVEHTKYSFEDRFIQVCKSIHTQRNRN